MKSSTFNLVLRQLNELSVNTEDDESILFCYILAQLNIMYSSSLTAFDGINNPSFSETISNYALTESLPEYIRDVRFIALSRTLFQYNLHTDYYSFFEYFTPRLISQWDKLNSLTSSFSTLDLTVVLYLTVSETTKLNIGFDEIQHKMIAQVHQRVDRSVSHLNLSIETFTQIWEAVFYIPMPKLKVGFSKKLIEAVKFYREHKVSSYCLLQNYCQYNKHKTHIDDALNPWTEFQRSIEHKPAISGVTIAETAFNHIRDIHNESPSDIIRASIYPHPEFFTKSSGIIVKPNNDGRFECSFLISEFEKVARVASKVLIVNPSPDFLLRWNDISSNRDCVCTIAVPNIYFASAYRMQFPNFRFCLYSDLDASTANFDLVAVISTTGEKIDLCNIVSQCNTGGRIFALLPQTILRKEHEVAELFTASYQAEKIISICSSATVTAPAKKMLIFIRKGSKPIDSLPVFFTQTDSKSDNLIIEKSFIRIRQNELLKNRTLNQLKQAEKNKLDAIIKTNRNKAQVYSFSDEIKLQYTVFLDQHGSYVGQVYYKSLLRQDKRRKSVWDTSATQRGLRSKDRQSVIARLESTAYYEQLAPYIMGDILQFYGDAIAGCSLKTIWFCCRNSLSQQSSYDDYTAQTILFPSTNTSLSSMYPEFATDEDYHDAMKSVIPSENKSVYKYWQQLNLIMSTAVSLGYLSKNPIAHLLPDIRKKASKEMINLRNALTKKTFTTQEEFRIFSFICAETDIEFGPRKAKRYEAESIWLLGALRLFTGISIREACALTWADYSNVGSTDTFQLSIFKFLKDDGTCSFILDDVSTKYSYRKIPIAPILSNMLNRRLTYMRAILGYTDSEIKKTPIILPTEQRAASKGKSSSNCKYSYAAKICREIIEAAQIPIQELVLPGKEETIIDMNKYMGDIFYSNFKHRANHVCAFSRGELSYILGNKGPDTFSQHYCDYSSDLIQYSMAQKLRRWTHKYEFWMPINQAISSTNNHIGSFSISTISRANHPYNCLDVTLTAIDSISGSYIDVNIECEHGIVGTISVFSKGD